MNRQIEFEPLLGVSGVAAMFYVDPKTVNRWARQGKIPSIRTPGGHYRFRVSDVKALLARTEGEK